MSKVGKVYKKEYEVHYYEVDNKFRCTLPSILNYLCDIGIWQSDFLGVGIDKLVEDNLTWVLYKYDLKINRYPKYMEKIIIETEPTGFKRFYGYRDYKIKGLDGEILLEGTGVYFLINITKRRPCRIPGNLYEAYGSEGDNKEAIEIREAVSKNEYMVEKQYIVRYADIDSNNHVNNVRYLEWALESVPVEIINNKEIKDLTITFKKEVTYGHTVTVHSDIEENEEKYIVYSKVINEQGEDLAIINTHWS